MDITQLRERRNAVVAKAHTLLTKVENNPDDKAAAQELRAALHESDRLKVEIEEADLRTIDRSQIIYPQGDVIHEPTDDDTAIKLEQHSQLRYFKAGESIRATRPRPDDPSLNRATAGEAIVSLIRGERRAASMASDVSGGYFLNDHIATGFIDQTRNMSALNAAGVGTITFEKPEAETMSFVTLDSDPVPVWRPETTEISESGPTFGKITARPRVVAALCKISEELAMSSPNASQAIDTALSRAMALEIDRACLLGEGTNEPVGLVNWDGITSTDFGGISPGADAYLNWAATIEEANGPLMPELSMILPPALYSDLRKLKDGEGAYLLNNMPEDFKRMRKVRSNQLRTNRGSGSDAAEAVVLSPRDVSLVMRSRVKIEIGRTSDDFSKLLLSIRAWCMVDVVCFKPAFVHWIDDIDV